MQKCTACWDRTAEGLQPSCVGSCPQRAIDFGNLDDLKVKYPGYAVSVVGLPDPAYGAGGNQLENETKPSIIFKSK